MFVFEVEAMSSFPSINANSCTLAYHIYIQIIYQIIIKNWLGNLRVFSRKRPCLSNFNDKNQFIDATSFVSIMKMTNSFRTSP